MKKTLQILLCLVVVLLLFVGGFLAFLSVKEYKPAPVEAVQPMHTKHVSTLQKTELSVLSFNVGYCALGDNADFFMDGGKEVSATTEERMLENVQNITKLVQRIQPDVALLQEVDEDAKRSYGLNQVTALQEGTDLSGAFALNYACPYVPYPVPPIGRVYAGLLTLTPYQMSDAERVALPCPFAWPIRTANLKRCLLVSHLPIENSDKELVLVNLHLEAYDDGEGKAAQTKMLFDILEKEYQKGNYVIAGGDFNQTFSGCLEAYPMCQESYWKPGVLENEVLPEGWQFVYDLRVPSCRLLNQPYDKNDEMQQHYILDGFIVSPNVTVQSVETLDYGFEFSDHNPVYAKLKLE